MSRIFPRRIKQTGIQDLDKSKVKSAETPRRRQAQGCPNGSILPQVAFFEKLAGETELTWVGAIKELSSALSGITINRSVYHKRTLISSGYIINLPTGIFVPISEMSIGIPNYGLINAGQNYVVILISSGGGWKLYFVNFSIGRSRSR